jgi:hypothetical protein
MTGLTLRRHNTGRHYNIHVYYCICHFPLVAICYVMFSLNGPISRFGTDIPGQNIRGGNEINWHVQDTTVLQPEVFLTGVYRLLITQSNNRVPTDPKVKYVLVSQQE